MKKAKITISRIGQHVGSSEIKITIKDASSGLTVCEIMLSPEKFAEAITGIGETEAKFTFMPNEFVANNIGKKREVKRINIEKPTYMMSKDEARQVIDKYIHNNNLLEGGWDVFDYGLTTQQPADKHIVVLWRFV